MYGRTEHNEDEEQQNKLTSEWFDEDYYDQETDVEQSPEKEAYENLVKIMEKYNFSQESRVYAIMKEENFKIKYKTTWYFKSFQNIPRFPDLKETINDLAQLFTFMKENIEYIYELDKKEPAKVVTKIWTNDNRISRLQRFLHRNKYLKELYMLILLYRHD